MFIPASRNQILLSWTLFFAVMICLFGVAAKVVAADENATENSAYFGVIYGSAHAKNQLNDITAFANWGGAPGTISKLDDSSSLAGLLVGKYFQVNDTTLRLEFDTAVSDIAAETNQLDRNPDGLDEMAMTEFHSISSLRLGVERGLNRGKLIFSGGIAIANVTNSVLDIDFNAANAVPKKDGVYRWFDPGVVSWEDPDDSFLDKSNLTGWVVGLGYEKSIDATRAVRVDGSWMSFGTHRYEVNKSGGNRCGVGGQRQACPYDVENNLSMIRILYLKKF